MVPRRRGFLESIRMCALAGETFGPVEGALVLPAGVVGV